jgi:hypothetical protein
MWGGHGIEALNDLWEWHGPGLLRPGAMMTVHWPSAGAGNALLTAIDTRWIAGGEGPDEELGTSGATLAVWERGAWTPLDSHAALTDAPEELEAVILDQTRIPGLLAGYDQELHLALWSNAQNGSEQATLAVDYLEATLTYLLTADQGGEP